MRGHSAGAGRIPQRPRRNRAAAAARGKGVPFLDTGRVVLDGKTPPGTCAAANCCFGIPRRCGISAVSGTVPYGSVPVIRR